MDKNKVAKFTAKQITHVALAVAFISVCSQICIPFTIPLTMQTFAIFLSVCILGEKKATFAILCYLALGFVGVPVFAAFQSGVGALFNPTGGFLLGFLLIPLASLAFGFVPLKFRNVVGLSIGLLLCYAVGVVWFALVYSNGNIGLIESLTVCVIPYVLPDALKLALAVFVGRAVKNKLG